MECKECGASLKENAQFCGVCGTKVKDLVSQCDKCSEIVNEGAKFCRHCGEEVEEPTAPTTGKLTKKNKKIIQLSAIGVGGLFLIIFTFILFKNKLAIPANNHLDLMLFKDYDDRFYAKSSGKNEYILKGRQGYQVLVSKDGKKIYTLDEDRDLYLQEASKTPERIARDVHWVMISPSGNTVAFMEDQDIYADKGVLYVKSGKNPAKKVSSEYCVRDSVSISQNGKYIAFTEIDGDYYDEDQIRNYLYPVGKEKIKGGKQISIGVDNKGTILARNIDQDLYMMRKGQEAKRIISEAETVIANKDFSKILVLDRIGNLYQCRGSDKEKLEGNVDYTAYIKGSVYSKDGIFYQTETKKLDIVFSKKDRLYMKNDGKESQNITSGNISEFRISKDFKSIAYVSNGGLYMKTVKSGKISEEEKIDSKVAGIDMDDTGSHIVYAKEEDLYYLPINKKEGIKIDTKDDVIRFVIKEDGSIYYETWGEDLFLTKGKSTGKKIAGNVSEWFITKQAAYILDYDDNLFEAIGKRKAKRIRSDVRELIRPIPNYYSLSSF